MNPFLGNILLLMVFSTALAAVVSGYREDDRSAVLVGTLRRGLKFCVAVLLIATCSWALGLWLS
jgi:hypothetical protein